MYKAEEIVTKNNITAAFLQLIKVGANSYVWAENWGTETDHSHSL